ncbi:hypothetical protein ACFVGM_08805 [Kitasatospora purpeofusca]|uniref:hypothetical protein n=1 Tax=Kitasatospora purpeofusca TaxID=67352 RepID=UPI00369CABA0
MRNERRPDPDAEYDPIRSLCPELLDLGLATSATPGPAPRLDGRERLRAANGYTKGGQRVGRDTLHGLAQYFVDRCPPLSWDTSLELGNYKALVALMGTFRRDLEMSPDRIRALIDFYWDTLGDRRPKRAWMWDFKGRYRALLEAFEKSGAATTAEDYAGWQTPETSAEEMRAAVAAAQAARTRRTDAP